MKSSQKWHKNKQYKNIYLKNVISQKVFKQLKIINLNTAIIRFYFPWMWMTMNNISVSGGLTSWYQYELFTLNMFLRNRQNKLSNEEEWDQRRKLFKPIIKYAFCFLFMLNIHKRMFVLFSSSNLLLICQLKSAQKGEWVFLEYSILSI